MSLTPLPPSTNADVIYECSSRGFGGGLEQTFHMEVRDRDSGHLLQNLSNSASPIFTVRYFIVKNLIKNGFCTWGNLTGNILRKWFVFFEFDSKYQTEICKLNLVWRRFWNCETWTFLTLQPFLIVSMMSAIYVSICKRLNVFVRKKSLNLLNVKLFSKIFFYILGFLLIPFCFKLWLKSIYLLVCYLLLLLNGPQTCNNSKFTKEKEMFYNLFNRWRATSFQ